MISIPATGTWEQKAGPVVDGLMKDLGLSGPQAAAFLGNFGVESVEFKTLHEIGQPEGQGGYGWGQWTGPRRTRFMNWCKKQKLDWKTPEANYGFTVYEVKSFYKPLLAKLKATHTIEEATTLIYTDYETPQEVLDGTYVSLPKRIYYAQRALKEASGAAPAPTPPTESPNLVYALQIQGYVTRIIQHELGLKIDGDYGEATRAAVLAYMKGQK